jgi:hypothetical protein
MKWIKTFEDYNNNKLKYEIYQELINDISHFNEVYSDLGFCLSKPTNTLNGIELSISYDLYKMLNKHTIFSKSFEYDGVDAIRSVRLNTNCDQGIYNLGFLNFNFNSEHNNTEEEVQFGTLIIKEHFTNRENISDVYNTLYNYIKNNVLYTLDMNYVISKKNKKIKIPYIKEIIVECLSHKELLTKEIIAKIFLDKIINRPEVGPILETMKETEWYEFFLKINHSIISLSEPSDMGFYD